MTSPHTPINPSKRFLGQSGISKYADFLMETDWSVGQIVRAIDDLGLSENTLIIFTADNGTPQEVTSQLGSRSIPGGKGLLTDAGELTLLSGGLSLRSLMPGWSFRAWALLERLLESAMPALAMFAHILLRRR